ncbi:putative transposase DNA-binding domain family [Hydrogenobacter thermophilus TK-6]|uniref:Uncharacterized protein n=1 Tax=Hydrogenobacter thermophilus (strain DSM 6534 / IAM 12695 / TK-6) TaxID=608538 RepID=D3DGI7_HYDTT|nr:hypothetical protein [Hydrogenobacter thermophilus]ADO44874.1 putative transposase DNA-binding domain family [Hydrogenobacter thermophilus TK-6]BAI68939.1 hypothetical protein HTH_0475 [Hydrogenobacter thermophilus TK-6]
MEGTLVNGTKSKPYMGKDTPGRVPFPLVSIHQKLLETSYLKPKSLIKYSHADKYELGKMER